MSTLLLFVVLALLTLSRSETKKSNNPHAQAVAKANAKLALQIAISQLQVYTGKDRCITARADLLDTRLILDATADSNLTNPNYTLAFQTTQVESSDLGNGVHLRKVRELPAYLVSGNERFNLLDSALTDYPTGYTTSTTPLDPTNSVTLAPQVSVPIVTLPQQGLNSRYAYWISDENLKARINIAHRDTAPDEDASSIEHLSNLRSTPALGTSIDENIPDLIEPEQLLTLSSIRLHQEPQSQHREKLHDLTAYSKSVLCDLKHGGLKRNLTEALLLDTEAFQQLLTHQGEGAESSFPTFPYQKWSFPSEEDTLSYRHYPGAPWELFRSYLRNAEYEPALSTSRPTLASHLSSAAHKLPHYWQTNPNHSGPRHLLDARLIRRSPTLLRFQISIDYSIQYLGTIDDPELGGTSHRFGLQQHFIPTVSFWNPYNVDLDVSEAIEYHIYLDRNWNVGRHNTHFRVHVPHDAPWKVLGLHTDKRKESISWSPPQLGSQSFYYPYHPDGNTTSGYTLARLSFQVPPFHLPAGSTATFSCGPTHQALNYSKSSPSTLTQQTSSHSNGYSFFTQNAELRVSTASLPEPTDAIPVLELLSYPSYKGDTHTRLHVTNASSFHRINWNFADLTQRAALHFTPTLFQANKPLSQSDLNGTQSPKFSAVAIRKFPEVEHYLPFGSVHSDDSNSFIAPWALFYQQNASRYSAYGTDSLGNNTFNSPPQYFTGLAFGSDPILFPDTTADAQCYVGHSDRATTGRTSAIQIALPRAQLPLFSPAHFSQINLAKWLNNYNADQSNASATDALTPSIAIANSFCPPHIPPTHSAVQLIDSHAYSHSNSATQYDSSFRYNEALWDRYFLTGEQSDSITNTEDIHTKRQAKYLTPLPNITLENWTSPQQSAAHLMLEGGFNINSTSVEAWKMLLASTIQPDGTSPFPRLQHTDSQSYHSPPSDTADPHLYDGSKHRALTTEEIDQLARNIVTQNKLRGPYASVAQFINRSLSPAHHYRHFAQDLTLTTDSVCYEGPLQAALNSSGINGAFMHDAATIPPNLSAAETNLSDYQQGKMNPKALKYHAGYGAPGTLTQADILNHIGHRLTARSDTFTVRAYGDALDTKGKVIARAYCEAVVQRFPEYCNSNDPAATPPQTWTLTNTSDQLPTEGHTAPNPELSNLSQALGRRYKVVSFRWLHPNEI